jgi:hypothetical protein
VRVYPTKPCAMNSQEEMGWFEAHAYNAICNTSAGNGGGSGAVATADYQELDAEEVILLLLPPLLLILLILYFYCIFIVFLLYFYF